MEEIKPDEAIQDVQLYNEQRSSRAEDALDYFLEKQNSLIKRVEVIDSLSEEYGWSEAQSNTAIGYVVGDLVDPVQQVVHPERGKLVGVIEYHEFPESGAYGYVDYDDVTGKRKRVVCSECVTEAETDVEVTHATEGEGTAPEDASWTELVTAVEDHYDTEHDVEPSEVEVGASLASGTTISGNTAFHRGNDGVGSGLDADSLEGQEPSSLGVPSGLIAVYSGSISNIPSGWTLCDGTDGTPNLQDNFIIGAGGSRSVNTTGGTEQVQLSEAQMPSHDHPVDTFGHSHSISSAEFRGPNNLNPATAKNRTGTEGTTDSETANVDVGFAGSNNSHENMPPFVALAYIMKL